MKPTILFISRFNNDFERFVALADSLKGAFRLVLLHIYPLERLPNSYILQATGNEDVPIQDPSFHSRLMRTYLLLNGLAREYRSSNYWELGQLFLNRANNDSHEIADRIFSSIKPNFIFMTCTTECFSSSLYLALHNLARLKSIAIGLLTTGIAFYAATPNHKIEKRPNSILEGDYLFAPSQIDFDHYIFPEIIMRGPFKELLPFGDPRLAKPFVKKISSYYQNQLNISHNSSKQISVAVFGTNVPNISDGTQEGQDLVLLNIVKWLAHQRIPKILVRFHPQTANTRYRDIIREIEGVETCEHLNSSAVLAVASHVVSPPTSVLCEAMVLGKPLVVVDDYKPTIKKFADLGVHSVSSSELRNLKIDDVQSDYSTEQLGPLIWGKSTEEDCRKKYLEFLTELI